VYERLEVQIGELRDRLGGLPHPVEAADIWRGLWFEEAHHSTAIEGNTLVLKQVEALLEQGRAVGNRELAPSTSRSRVTPMPPTGSTTRRYDHRWPVAKKS
jgi:hypothetical protein